MKSSRWRTHLLQSHCGLGSLVSQVLEGTSGALADVCWGFRRTGISWVLWLEPYWSTCRQTRCNGDNSAAVYATPVVCLHPLVWDSWKLDARRRLDTSLGGWQQRWGPWLCRKWLVFGPGRPQAMWRSRRGHRPLVPKSLGTVTESWAARKWLRVWRPSPASWFPEPCFFSRLFLSTFTALLNFWHMYPLDGNHTFFGKHLTHFSCRVKQLVGYLRQTNITLSWRLPSSRSVLQTSICDDDETCCSFHIILADTLKIQMLYDALQMQFILIYYPILNKQINIRL